MAFPRALINNLLHDAQHGATAQIRGQALEQAAVAMFTSVPGVLPPAVNVVDYATAGEIDIFFPNRPTKAGLWFFERAFLCECKNWNNAAGVQEIMVFLQRMRERNCQYGVFISSNGITGDPAILTAANNQVAGALAEGYEIVVLDWEDLRAVKSSPALVSKMLERWTRLKSFRTSV